MENESRRQDADAAAMMDQAQQRIRELVVELDEKHLNLKVSFVCFGWFKIIAKQNSKF